MQVIGIAQHHLALQLLQVISGNTALDGSRRRHIHKGRRLHRTMYGGKRSPPGCSFCQFQLIHSFYSSLVSVTHTSSGGLKSRIPIRPRPSPRLRIIVLSSIW